MENKENEKLLKKVKELEQEIVKLKDSLEQSKKLIDVKSVQIPLKLYIIGKYNGFNKEKGALDISVEGNQSYYELSEYGSTRLPFPDSRVLIFNIENSSLKKPLILGFEGGRLINLASIYIANIISINYLQNTLSLKTEYFGNITLSMTDNFLKNINLRCGDNIMIKSIQVATELFFVPVINNDKLKVDKNKIYSFLSNTIN